ncbi:MAG TPA: hypothetical protein DDY68_00160, partial [Porphyromonadaceae bacterium]|nr:hypothetical protein [Porphyromonadaceae bacterium]
KLDSTRNSTTGVYEYTYNAHNIANYFVSYRNSDPQNTTAWDTLGIVPVMVTKNSSGDIQRVDSYVYPASIQFIKGLERGRVLVVYSTF